MNEQRYVPAPTKLFKKGIPFERINDEQLKEKARKLEELLDGFGISIKVADITYGPTVTRFGFSLPKGMKISSLNELRDDIQMALSAFSVRIDVIPGRAMVGIELVNDKPCSLEQIGIRRLLETEKFISSGPLNVAIGWGISGRPIYGDISKMPHLLIAGSSGTGKTCVVSSMLMSILCKASPEEVRLILADTKVVDFAPYSGIPHLLVPVISHIPQIIGILRWARKEIERRFEILASQYARDIHQYNQCMEKTGGDKIPDIVIVIDDIADITIYDRFALEEVILPLALRGRKAGVHIVLVTQRATLEVITGTINQSIPSRIALETYDGCASRVILGMTGAEQLVGKGDMLFWPAACSRPIRCQGAYVSTSEIDLVTDYLKKRYGPDYDAGAVGFSSPKPKEIEIDEDIFKKAVDIVIDQGIASVSLLQRKLALGYPHASRIIALMEERGIIGPFEGRRPRKVLIDKYPGDNHE